MKVRCRTGEVATSYTEYLNTKWWKGIRQRLQHKRRCFHCGNIIHKNQGWTAHHRTRVAYTRLGRERLGWPYKDVVKVCNACHDGKSPAHHKLHKDTLGYFTPGFAKINKPPTKRRKRTSKILWWSILLGTLVAIYYFVISFA